MEPTILQNLESLLKKHEEIGVELSTPEIINNQNRYRALSKEFSQLEPVVNCYKLYKAKLAELETTELMLQESDKEMRVLAEEELKAIKPELAELEQKLKILLLPQDPHDQSNVFLEIRAGTGGDEAAIFAGDLFRMYSHFVEDKGWRLEIISSSEGEHGGFKEIIVRIIGNGAYSQLKFESGAHRVQRVPETEAQGRIHTSTCTVAVFPEAEEIDKIDINPADLKIDTFRSSGAGGQHVNVTDSAVRITHIPTGVVVECQDERSQHKNRAKAMSLLSARLLAAEQEKQQREQAQTRKSLIGTGDRSERIRTYNFPQGRLTDHRINLTLYSLEKIIDGDLSQVIDPLIQAHQAELLAGLK